tara:strand:- start:903 stop:1532 length:630 start_codon:yes stop_codon:yes gene_type:complete
MNLSKFLILDAALAIGAIPVLFLLKDKKTSLFRSSKEEESLEKTHYKLPDKEKLLELERIASVKGSEIEFDSLVGDWKFVSVWKKDTDKENSIFSSLLRLFSANLALKKKISTENLPTFSIIASIKFGLISIEFSGTGYLKGKQPSLTFSFNLIELKSGPNLLLCWSLEEPIDKEKSFFALIASGKNDEWLSARGQGGALLLWLKNKIH